jgi:hypothetical protein
VKNRKVKAALEAASVLTFVAGVVTDGAIGSAITAAGMVFVVAVWWKGGFR